MPPHDYPCSNLSSLRKSSSKRIKKALAITDRPEGSSSGLLSLRAIDLDTQLIAVQQIVKVDDLAAALSIEDEMLEDGLHSNHTS